MRTLLIEGIDLKMTARVLLALVLLGGFAVAQTPPPHPFWSGDAVHEIRLTFAQPDWYEQLTANYAGSGEESIYLPATFEWGSVKFNSIGVRFKGSSSYRVNSTKKPFRLKLNEFVKGQKIDGIGAFNLSNGFNDPSMVREGIYYEMASQLGLKAPRTNFAALYVNDQYWGLYVLGEVENSDFLKNYFGKGEDSGNLYKGNQGATFAYLGPSPDSYRSAWEKQTNEDKDDWSDLISLLKTLDETPPDQMETVMGQLIDIDSFLTAMALDNATVNLDNYIGVSQNFNIYRRPSDGKWVWIVWDPSLAFGAVGLGVADAIQYPTEFLVSNDVGPGGGGRPLYSKLMAVPSIEVRYMQIYKELVAKVFIPNNLLARMATLRDMIRPYIVNDAHKLMTLAQFDSAIIGSAIGAASAPALQPLIEGRESWLTGQLASAATGAVLIADQSSLQFTVTTDAPTTTQKVSLSYSGVGTLPSYSVLAATSNGETWLTPLPTGGPLPASFKVSVNAGDLTEGTYDGTVSVFLSGASNSPLVLPVTLTVQAAGSIKPDVLAVTNAASYATGSVAPGEILTLFGAGLGPSDLTFGTGGAEVTFDGIPANVIYSRDDTLSVVVPMQTSGASTTMAVTYGDQTSSKIPLTVKAASPGIFTLDASGAGQGAILNQNASINGLANPAVPGSIISIFLTGAGTVDASGLLTGHVTVTIGGQPATIQYAGAAPAAVVGLYQINATIPGTAGNGELPVVVSVDGASSQQAVTVAIR